MPANAAIAEHGKTLADAVLDGAEDALVIAFAPIVLFLPGVEEGVVTEVGKGSKNDPVFSAK